MRMSGLISADWWRGLINVLRHGLALPNGELDQEISAHREAVQRYRSAMYRTSVSNTGASLNARRTQELARSVLKRVERRQ